MAADHIGDVSRIRIQGVILFRNEEEVEVFVIDNKDSVSWCAGLMIVQAAVLPHPTVANGKSVRRRMSN